MLKRICAAVCIVASLALPPSRALAQDTLFVDVRQGTDLSLTTAPGLDFIVIELLGRLWRIPITGGAAVPLSAPEVTVRHPRLSPDASRVVYQRLDANGWNIWLLELASGEHVQVTQDPGNEREPEFLPDSTGIVFASDRSGKFDLWSTNAPGAPWAPISTDAGDARYPSVAENGAIAYVVEDERESRLRISAEGLTQTVYTTAATLGAPTWRPGGGVIVFSERAAESTALRMAILAPELLIRRLTEGEDLFASRIGWTDAATFVYAADGQIWRRRLAGRTRRPVHLFATAVVAPSQRPRTALDVRSSLPETLVADTSRDGEATVFAAAGDIWLYRDNEPVQLTSDDWWNEDPRIDPQGRYVVFARSNRGERRLWRAPIDGTSDAEPLTPSGVRAFGAALDPSGERLAWLSSESGFSEFTPARLNTLRIADGTRRRSAMTLRALDAPQWLADSSAAMLSVATLQSDGTQAVRAFDAALQIVAAEAAQPEPDTTAEIPAPSLPIDLDTRAARTAGGAWVIQAGRVFDGIGTGYRRHVDIHIENGRISAIVARGRLPLPLTVIDATDYTVLPGLIDLHVHDSGLLGELAGRAWLAWGVTTVRSVGPHSAAQRAVAAAWQTGLLPGPRYIEAVPAPRTANAELALQPPALLDDPFVTLPGEGPQISLFQNLLPALPQAGGGALTRRFSPGNIHYQDVFALLSASGATEMTSLGAFSPAATDRLLTRNADARAVYGELFSERDQATWRAAPALLDAAAARQESLTRLLRAGVPIAIGSESPQTPPGLGVHVELGLFAAAGVPNDQVLRAATSGAALALGLESEIGTIEAGRRADLVLVAGDPLNAIGDALNVLAVVRDGEWLERAALTERVRRE